MAFSRCIRPWPRPGRCKVRILIDTLPVEVEGHQPHRAVSCALIATEVELVGMRGSWHVVLEHLLFAPRQRNRQRLDDTLREAVLHREQIAERRLAALRPQHSPPRRLQQLGIHTNLIASPHKCSGQHGIHVDFTRQTLQVRGPLGELSRRQTRPYDQRLSASSGPSWPLRKAISR